MPGVHNRVRDTRHKVSGFLIPDIENRKQMSMQRILRFILPARAFAAIKTGTKQWLVECPCGKKLDYWDIGGIRYRAVGEPRLLLRCPSCGKVTPHRIRKKTGAEKSEMP